MALTETEIRKLKNPAAPMYISDGRNLYLKSYPTGRRTWQVRTRKGGSWRTVTLGTWPSMSLAQARARCSELTSAKIPDSATASSIAMDWFERVIEPNYKTPHKIETYVTRWERLFGNRPIRSISKPEIIAALEDYAKTSPVAANRCRSNWKLMLDFATERGLLDVNPLAGTTNRIAGGNEKSRDRVLDDAEIVAMWHDGHEHSPLLRFLLTTGLRIGEAQAAHKDHIKGDLLHVPENKSDRPHWVTLTKLAREQTGDFDGDLFEPRSPTAVQARLRRTGCDWTPHDLRRTFATRLAGLGCPIHIVEKMLNHQMQGVAAVYNRHEYEAERIEWAQKWSDVLEALVNG